jgi:hypothetical protein
MAYIVAVKSMTKSIARVDQHLVFEPAKVYEVQPGFITTSDLRSCKTIVQLEELCNKYTSPQVVIAIIDSDQINLVCEHTTILHTIHKSKARKGLCPICERDLNDNVCSHCGLNWKTATNEEIAKVMKECYKGAI